MLGGMEGKVTHTSKRSFIEGSNGVWATTWVIKGVNKKFADGADIEFEGKGSYTPCQLVNKANVVTDAPDGKCYCCVMASGWEKPKVFHFNGSQTEQMVWDEGMLIFWIVEEPMKLTEFESEAYNNDMFVNISDDMSEVPGYPQLDLKSFRAEVNKLKERVNQS